MAALAFSHRIQGMFLLQFFATLATVVAYAQSDTNRVAFEIVLEPITITARVLHLGAREATLNRETLYELVESHGVGLIRRGLSLTPDFYLQGFKRGEVAVTIDGERFYHACPNRMDPPLVRVNPLELASISIDPSGLALQSGLGGQVAYKRRSPTQAWEVNAALQSRLGAESSFEGAVTASGQQHRLSLRWLSPRSYTTGRGQSFGTLYGYRHAHIRSHWFEGSLEGRRGSFQYGGGYFQTRDLPFPYLKMDERDNQLGHAFLAYAGHRLYANYSWHVMDNGLRSAGHMMPMKTEAQNVTVGLVGALQPTSTDYELYYRFWDARVTQEGRSSIIQASVPAVRMVGGSIAQSFRLAAFWITGRVGITSITLGNKDRLELFRMLYPAAKAQRWFVPFALGLSHRTTAGSHAQWGLQIEIVSEAPEVEQLYVGMHGMMDQPHWVANPTLAQPVRLGLQWSGQWQHITLRLYGTHVWNYVYLQRLEAHAAAWQTYRNIHALLLGGEARLDWSFGTVQTSYTWGQDLTARNPLAEMQPWTVRARLHMPERWSLQGWIALTYQARQDRVDRSLQEITTPSWHRIDLGVRYHYRPAELRLEVHNVLNRTYRQHLSYLRNPYRTAAPVYEPGRTLLISLLLQL